MLNYRLSYNVPSGLKHIGFDTEKEALLWAYHKERQGHIKAVSLMKFDPDCKEYKEIKDFRTTLVDMELPFAGQNKKYHLTYVLNRNQYEVLVEAPSPKAAERYFHSRKPEARSLKPREASPEDLKSGIPVLVLTEQEEKTLRDAFLSSTLDELDLSVRSYNALRRAGMETIRELVCKSVTNLKKVPNLGWKGIAEITSVLNAHGEVHLPSLEVEQEKTKKPSLDDKIRSVAHYAENETVRDAVLQSDKLRNETLDACEKIPGYALLPKEDKNRLYDMVKKAVSLSIAIEKGESPDKVR